MTASVAQSKSQARNASRVWARLAPYIAATSGDLFLAVLAFVSLITDFASAIPGLARNTDYSIFYWNVWWFQHAMLQLGQDPFYTNYILFPHTLNLAYHSLSPFLDVLAFPGIQQEMNTDKSHPNEEISHLVKQTLVQFLEVREREGAQL